MIQLIRPVTEVVLGKQDKVKNKAVKTLIGSFSDENSSNCNINHVGEIKNMDKSDIQTFLQAPIHLPSSLPPIHDNNQSIIEHNSRSSSYGKILSTRQNIAVRECYPCASNHIFAAMLSQIFGEHH